MPALTDRHFGRYVFAASLMAVLGLAAAAMWIRADILLKKAEQNVRAEFSAIERYPNLPSLPPLTIAGPDGQPMNLSNYKGQYVLLNLWATWCGPCVVELPLLQNLKNHYSGSNFTVLAVSIDEQRDIVDVGGFLKKHKIGDVALYHDFQGEVQKALPINSLPTSFLIGPRGKILYRITGVADWRKKEIIEFFDAVQKLY